MQTFRYFLEAFCLCIFTVIFKCLPVEAASNFGGWLGRTIGPRMGASGKAHRHLEKAMPELSVAQRETIVRGMWDNLGRVLAEYPHIETISRDRTVIESSVDVDQYKCGDKGAVFFSAHIGNWEMGCSAPYLQLGIEVDSTYRAPNNPWVDHLLFKSRTLGNKLKSYSKSRKGGAALLKAAKQKRNIAILIDQKYNEGIEASFFGHSAMTNPIFVQLGQKYGLDVLPAHIVREGPARFRMYVDAPLELYEEDGSPKSEADVIRAAHRHLENWIRTNPEQWIWLHRRWKD